MKEILPSVEIVSYTPELEKVAEICARTCYKSEDRLSKNTKYFLESLIKNEHLSVLEHNTITIDVVCDRGISHELVRHRLASFSQESTRYCNYVGSDIKFIRPCSIETNSPSHLLWLSAMAGAEKEYKVLIGLGNKAEIARSVLPTSLATSLKMSANAREWRHIFKLRTSKAAHPDMRNIMNQALSLFKDKWPIIFGDLTNEM